MATSVASLAVQLSANDAGFEAGVTRAEKRLQQFEKAQEKAAKKRAQTQEKFGKAAVASSAALRSFDDALDSPAQATGWLLLGQAARCARKQPDTSRLMTRIILLHGWLGAANFFRAGFS